MAVSGKHALTSVVGCVNIVDCDTAADRNLSHHMTCILSHDRYWLSPFAWAVRSVAIMEFTASRYYTADGTWIGKEYLEAWSIQTDFIYTWAGVAYLVGLYLIFILVGALALAYKRHETSIGVKRRLDLEDEEERAVALRLPHPYQHRESVLPAESSQYDADSQQLSPSNGSKSETQSQEKSTVTADSDVALDIASAASALAFTPATLVWRHIGYTVTLADGRKKKLLNDIDGFCRPGQMTALMGQSGAGEWE